MPESISGAANLFGVLEVCSLMIGSIVCLVVTIDRYKSEKNREAGKLVFWIGMTAVVFLAGFSVIEYSNLAGDSGTYLYQAVKGVMLYLRNPASADVEVRVLVAFYGALVVGFILIDMYQYSRQRKQLKSSLKRK